MSQATEMRDLYINAEKAILEGKEYQDSKGRVFKREDLDLVRAGRIEWERKAAAEQVVTQKQSRFKHADFSHLT